MLLANLLHKLIVLSIFWYFSISIAFVVPFYAASLVETVQSDIASEKPGIFDIFREGCNRLIAFHVPQKGRMIPVWALIGPSVAMGISKYIVGYVISVGFKHKQFTH